MITIQQGDCRQLQRAFDVMITDPPYSAHVHKNAVSQSVGGGVRDRELGFDHLTDDLLNFTCELAAKTNRWSVIFSDVESVGKWIDCLRAHDATYVRAVPWVRWSMPQLSGDRPPAGCEMLILAHGKQAGRKHWTGPGSLTHLAHTCLRGSNKHKAEKPLDMVLDLVSWFSDYGETVIDPFTGSGTTALACKILGRSFNGCEIDPKWAAFAAERVHGEWSKRDRERIERWSESHKRELDASSKRAEHTAKIREKLEQKKQQARETTS